MTIDDIANYCEVMDCTVQCGSPEDGFVSVDGTGLRLNRNNYRRFLMFHELGALPSPRKVLEKATTFKIQEESGERALTRPEFEEELQKFSARVGL